MITFPNAKINLGLHVTEKRPDGYHNIESVFYPIPLKEPLEIATTPGTGKIIFHASGLPIPGRKEENLIVKAIEKFGSKAVDYTVYLHKAIPMGGGLGGGSADAAFTLKLLDELGVRISDESIFDQAMALGSDCGYFIHNSPAFVSGRGEHVEPILLDLTGWYLVLVFPGIHVSTQEAYAGITPQNGSLNLQTLAETQVSQWKNHVVNFFERSVFSLHPLLAKEKENLYQKGAIYASMSGSGSTLFGLFTSKEKAEAYRGSFSDTVVLEL